MPAVGAGGLGTLKEPTVWLCGWESQLGAAGRIHAPPDVPVVSRPSHLPHTPKGITWSPVQTAAAGSPAPGPPTGPRPPASSPKRPAHTARFLNKPKL